MAVGDENDDDRLAELNPRSRTCVVLGGRGFIGRSLVLRLLRLGKWIVRVADSAQSLRLEPSESDSVLSHALASGRASYHRVDVRDKSMLVNAIEGSSVVFYCNDADLHTDDFFLCYMMIVQGAKNVINACRECKVRRLVYNSFSDVVCDGLHDIINGDESLPYPKRFQDSSNELKAEAEALILFANSIDGLLTCAIRPSNVYGPGDTDLVPFFVNLARSSWTKFIIGSGDNISDFTYVENVAHALICAEESLHFRMASVAGKAFFISDLDAMNFWDFAFLILGGLGYQRRPPLIKLPISMVWLFVMFMKWIHKKWGFPKFSHSMFRYMQLALHSRTVRCSEAQKLIGYKPVVSLKEGVSLTIKSFSCLAHDMSFSRYMDHDEPSKVEKLLGGGNVAEVLLWRDEKRSFTCFLTFVLLFNWFFLSGRTFAASFAKLSLLVLSVLFGYAVLPPNIFGFTIKRVSLSCFEIPEVVVKDSVAEIAHIWNRGFRCITFLSQQQDWTIFFKISAFLYFLTLASHSLTMVIGFALVFSFTAFFVYEQYETEIDDLGNLLLTSVKDLVRFLERKYASLSGINSLQPPKYNSR